MTRFLAPLLIGFLGAAILIALGVWQVQRLEWKQGIVAEIESTIGAEPIALPDAYDAAEHRYRPVALDGSIAPGEAHVLVSRKQVGAGYRVIAPFVTDEGRRVLIDRGFIPIDAKETNRRIGATRLNGNLYRPEERSGFTPENDLEDNIWYARDVDALAEALDAEPLLVVVRNELPEAPGLTPLPVSSAGIPNDHLQYAITWFSLAAVWIGMTLVWLRRGTTARKERTPT